MASISGTFSQRKRIQHKPNNASVKSSITKNSPVSPAQKELDILKKFDLTLEFGPCIGITRMERWQRADKHGLNPPAEVKDIVSQHKDDETYTECLWNDYNILK